MKTKLIIIINLIIISISLVVSTATVYAWFSSPERDVDVDGSAVGGFFAGGDGSKSSPYLINEPRHVYNLAWLQYYGNFDSGVFYFRLNSDIDMEGMAIPPIGTSEHPFKGVLTGSKTDNDYYKIANVVTTTNERELYMYDSTLDYSSLQTTNVGFFGETATGSKVTDLYLINPIVKVGYASTSDSVNNYVGIIAGKADGTFAQVYVANSSLYGNLYYRSMYNLFGYSSNLSVGEGIPSQNNLLDTTFDATKLIQVNGVQGDASLVTNASFNEVYQNEFDLEKNLPYNPNVFDISGEFKLRKMTSSYGYDKSQGILYEESWFNSADEDGNGIRDEYEAYLEDPNKNSTTYSGKSVKYNVPADADNVYGGIQFQNEQQMKGRYLSVKTTGKGKIFLVGSGNAPSKMMNLYKKVNETWTLVDTITFSAVEKQISCVGIEVEDAAEYRLTAAESNTYVFYLRFIISSNYGSDSSEIDGIINCDYTYIIDSIYANDNMENYVYGGVVIEIEFSNNTDLITVDRTSSSNYLISITSKSPLTIYNSSRHTIDYNYNGINGSSNSSKIPLVPS